MAKETALQRATRILEEVKEQYDNIRSPFLFKKWQEAKQAHTKAANKELKDFLKGSTQPTLL